MMKAAVWHNFNDMRIEELPRPEIGPGEILVDVRVAQPSITDVEFLSGMLGDEWTIYSRHQMPDVFGHEFSGDVVEVAGDITGLKKGDRVGAFLGGNHRAFAQFMAIAADQLIRLPDNLSYNEGACIQPLAGCISVVKRAPVQLGDTVVVVGQGVMGLGCLQAFHAAGAGRVFTTDVRPEALELSHDLGADEAIDASKMDPVRRVRELTEGVGADIVVECAGGKPEVGLAGTSSVEQALAMVRRGGTVCLVAFYQGSLTLDMHALRQTDVQIIMGGAREPPDTKRVAALVAAGRIRLAPTVTHVLKGLEGLPEAFAIMANKADRQAIQAQVELE
jgi:2-desacetyl-2-hydroxyethyl bacteriochlorophyllide A dehydrogenase